MNLLHSPAPFTGLRRNSRGVDVQGHNQSLRSMGQLTGSIHFKNCSGFERFSAQPERSNGNRFYSNRYRLSWNPLLHYFGESLPFQRDLTVLFGPQAGGSAFHISPSSFFGVIFSSSL